MIIDRYAKIPLYTAGLAAMIGCSGPDSASEKPAKKLAQAVDSRTTDENLSPGIGLARPSDLDTSWIERVRRAAEEEEVQLDFTPNENYAKYLGVLSSIVCKNNATELDMNELKYPLIADLHASIDAAEKNEHGSSSTLWMITENRKYRNILDLINAYLNELERLNLPVPEHNLFKDITTKEEFLKRFDEEADKALKQITESDKATKNLITQLSLEIAKFRERLERLGDRQILDETLQTTLFFEKMPRLLLLPDIQRMSSRFLWNEGFFDNLPPDYALPKLEEAGGLGVSN